MKFSLKDIFTSISIASLGLAALTFLFRGPVTRDTNSLLIGILLYSPGVFFSAAVGNLFHRTKMGLIIGLILGIFIAPMLVFMSAYALFLP